MAKPIFLVQVQKDISGEELKKIKDALSDHLNDWHVLVSATISEGIKCSSFIDREAEDIDIENLQKLILNQLQPEPEPKKPEFPKDRIS